MSNTRNKTANKKKRKEKGLRAEFLGSNPHSNGLIFSRCELEWYIVNFATVNKVAAMKIANVVLKKNISIYQEQEVFFSLKG